MKYRWLLLLVASYYFYMSWKAEYAILIAGSTLVDFYAASAIERATSRTVKKRWLAISLVTNLGILSIFKYYNFFRSELANVLS